MSKVERVSKATGELVTICTDAAWQKVREALSIRAMGFCEKCGRWAPLHGYGAGHAHHVKGWACPACHKGEHQPAKVVPSKEQLMAQRRDVSMYLTDEDFPEEM